MMEGNTIFEAGDIRITKSVASFGNTSFLIANITSLAVTSKPSSSVAQQLASGALLIGTISAALYSWTVAGVFLQH
jgi:hypothetical protein